MTDASPSPTKRAKRITAQAVADAAGVSRSAVSRAFTPGAYLDAEKKDRIQKVAAEMGYHPNALAAGLNRGRSNLVAVFIGHTPSAYDQDFLTELVSGLTGMRRWPILIDGGSDRPRAALDDVLRYPLDALIVRGGSMPADMVERCAQLGIPMISSGRILSAPGVDNVCCRNADGTALATHALVDRGRRRFAFIGGPQSFYSSGERLRGVTEALATHDLKLVARSEGDFTVAAGDSGFETLVRNHDLDAIICANDATAIGALAAARRLGIAIPEDMSVMGFDDISMSKWPMFNLSTVRNPITDAVQAILHLLERRLADPNKTSETHFIDPYLKLRGTH